MKKLFSFLMATAILFSSYAAAPSADLSVPASIPSAEIPVLNANQIMLPVGNTGKTISLKALSEITVKEFEMLSGKKLNFADKIGFKLGQKKLRNKIEADGTIKGKTLRKLANKMAADGETGFHVGGFALGFLLGLIGLLIAYLINDDYKSNRVKWAWLGFGLYLIIVLAVVLASAA